MHTISPFINPNGSHPDRLIEDMAEARHALDLAMDAMGKLCPHGRDYQGGGDYKADHREHWRRIGVVQELMDQYLQEALAIRKEAKHGRACV